MMKKIFIDHLMFEQMMRMILTWRPALADRDWGAFFDFPLPNFPPFPPFPPFPAYILKSI